MKPIVNASLLSSKAARTVIRMMQDAQMRCAIQIAIDRLEFAEWFEKNPGAVTFNGAFDPSGAIRQEEDAYVSVLADVALGRYPHCLSQDADGAYFKVPDNGKEYPLHTMAKCHAILRMREALIEHKEKGCFCERCKPNFSALMDKMKSMMEKPDRFNDLFFEI